MIRSVGSCVCLSVVTGTMIQYIPQESFLQYETVFAGQEQETNTQGKDPQKRAQDAVRRFLSGDPLERQRAQELLNQLGQDALPSILSVVALRPHRLDASGEKDGIQELLRGVQPEIAAPYFIEIVENQPVDDLFEMPIPAERALILIGPAAVPYVIDSMQTIRKRLEASEFGGPPVTEEHKRVFFNAETVKVQRRDAVVLGEIGDVRAKGPLKALFEPPNDPYVIERIKSEVDEALERIEKKNRPEQR